MKKRIAELEKDANEVQWHAVENKVEKIQECLDEIKKVFNQ